MFRRVLRYEKMYGGIFLSFGIELFNSKFLVLRGCLNLMN